MTLITRRLLNESNSTNTCRVLYRKEKEGGGKSSFTETKIQSVVEVLQLNINHLDRCADVEAVCKMDLETALNKSM